MEQDDRYDLHHVPQPPCDGPKLPAFQYWNSEIEWLERLDGDREIEEEPYMQGFVFRVRIEYRDYALKVVSSTVCLSRRLSSTCT